MAKKEGLTSGANGGIDSGRSGGIIEATLLVVRIALKDRTLRRELPGHEEYASEVRYRLVPCVW